MSEDDARIRAGYSERDATLSRLGDAFASGYLDQDEFEARSSQASTARFRDDLVGLTRDLPHQLAVPEEGTQVPTARVRMGEVEAPRHENVVAIFGGANREADWIASSTASMILLFGGAELDLRHCVWPADGRIEVTCFIAFGGAEIKVPEGVRVINHIVPLFGGAGTDGVRPSRTGPVLVLRGVALFGGIGVTGPDARDQHHGD
ncbi:DUF1707 SHOCT-like domain-containing protein [Acidipropionibacterium jensenii]|uniref:DUF1707 SHOCT-like domain-containing protein n=1 Tax=Acidipropionibacterium jensenii TaxID=1749 RepID=UPI00264A0055|nr:DUF1707 domain-containing protein [Acidipropionibacterium jensenii]MDN5976166.1 DUF1707 domain-containing protein [Acidipropionibacterium jensenii]MDN5995964.1 DUF1707 domain-containing protein [Acidipropionibacterium jensenii]MDN6020966.1 DUF1707 domain-containing protein [Acidipropionibacterium jensenii]MDN6425957.1 DUF1707 domain-containing protein [Acidipropionibacterium jensenii]MDN6440451.1 DUF1707 domain-containing protein [Acidipropionibacterium jensenii]